MHPAFSLSSSPLSQLESNMSLGYNYKQMIPFQPRAVERNIQQLNIDACNAIFYFNNSLEFIKLFKLLRLSTINKCNVIVGDTIIKFIFTQIEQSPYFIYVIPCQNIIRPNMCFELNMQSIPPVFPQDNYAFGIFFNNDMYYWKLIIPNNIYTSLNEASVTISTCCTADRLPSLYISAQRWFQMNDIYNSQILVLSTITNIKPIPVYDSNSKPIIQVNGNKSIELSVTNKRNQLNSPLFDNMSSYIYDEQLQTGSYLIHNPRDIFKSEMNKLKGFNGIILSQGNYYYFTLSITNQNKELSIVDGNITINKLINMLGDCYVLLIYYMHTMIPTTVQQEVESTIITTELQEMRNTNDTQYAINAPLYDDFDTGELY